MTQQLKQDVVVDVTVKGGDEASKVLTTIETKLKSIEAQARRVSTALGSLNKVNGTQKMNKELSSVNKTMDASTSKARKLNTIWKNMDGSKKIVPLAAVKTPKIATMTDMSPAVTGMGMKTPKAAGSALASNEAAKAAAATGNASAKAAAGVNKFQRSLDSAGKSAKAASWNFFRTRAAIAAVAMVAAVLGTGVKKWFDLASDYAESNHLFYTTLASSLNDVADAEKTASIEGKDLFGNTTGDSVAVTQAVADAANEVERLAAAMMIDPTQMKRTYATFYEMANSAGMATDKIMKLSQGMTQLTYDLASLWDFSFEEVSSKLQSGIAGISSSVRSLGIDISRTAADHWLLTNGIDATYRALTRADKMAVMYNMLMEHTTTAQGDLARSALQPANMLRILSEQARLAARMMGGAIFPVLTKLIPLFIMFAQAIQTAATTLANFLGLKLGGWYAESKEQWNSYMANLNGSFSGGGIDLGEDETEGALEGVGDAATDTGKKLKEMTDFTLPFDELNVLKETVSAGSGSGGGAGGLGGGLGDLNIPMLDPYQWDQDINAIILGDAQKTLDTIKQKIADTFGVDAITGFQAATNSMWTNLKRNAEEVRVAFTDMVHALDPFWSWGDFFLGFAQGFNDVTTAVSKVVQAVLKAVPGLVDFLTNLPIIGDLFKTLFENLDSSSGYIVGFMLALKGVMSVGKLFLKVFSPIKAVLSPIVRVATKLGGAFVKLTNDGKKVKTADVDTELEKIRQRAKHAKPPVDAVGTSMQKTGTKASSASKKLSGFKFAGVGRGPIGSLLTLIRLFQILNTGIDFSNIGEQIKTGIGNITTTLNGLAANLPAIFDSILASAPALFSAIGTLIMNVIELLPTYIPIIMEGAKNLFMSMADAIPVVIPAIVEGLTSMIVGIVELLPTFLETLLTGAITLFTAFVDAIPLVLPTIIEALISLVTILSEKLPEFIPTLIEGAVNLFTALADSLPVVLPKVIEGLISLITQLLPVFVQMLPTILRGAIELFKAIVEALPQVLPDIVDALVVCIEELIPVLIELIPVILEGAVQLFMAIVEALPRIIPKVIEGIGKVVGKLFEWITTDGVRIIGEGAGKMVDSFLSIFSNFKIDFPPIKLPHFKWSTQSFLGITIPIFGGIDWYAKGGIFNSPTVAGIGEAGPEAVVPLQGARMRPFADAIAANLQGNNNTNLNGSGASLDSDALVVAISTAVYNAMIQGFPSEIKSNLYLNGVKVNKELDNIKRQQNASTSPLSVVG